MPADRFGAPWPGATYNGFSGPAGAPPPDPVLQGPHAPRSRRPSRGALIGGIAAAAIALGLAAGFAFRPDHRALNEADEAPPSAPHMPIQVNQPPPPQPLPHAVGKLEVLNPATAEAARAAQPTAIRAAPAAPPSPGAATPNVTAEIAPTPPPPSPAPPRLAVEAQPPQLVVPRAPSGLDACAARSRAEALVCADPQLAAYDRELNRAYRRAMRSGAVSPDDLRADQRDWLDDRERAARRSPQAMSDLYQDRIDELNRIADNGPGA